MLRFGRLVVVATAPSVSLYFRRLHSKKAAEKSAASPINTPRTMPAIAPPDNPFRCIVTESDALPGFMITVDGVDVTVCVTIVPDTVVTWTVVLGATLIDDDEEENEDEEELEGACELDGTELKEADTEEEGGSCGNKQSAEILYIL